jgi:mediator of RNA polymerase II transcription subunit 21
MTSSLQYLTTRTNFLQISEAIPVTKQRNPDKYDPQDVFEGNQRELVEDLIMKAKQVEYLIDSLPVPEPEDQQALRLQTLQHEMEEANEQYRKALDRAKRLHAHISEVLQKMLANNLNENQGSSGESLV